MSRGRGGGRLPLHHQAPLQRLLGRQPVRRGRRRPIRGRRRRARGERARLPAGRALAADSRDRPGAGQGRVRAVRPRRARGLVRARAPARHPTVGIGKQSAALHLRRSAAPSAGRPAALGYGLARSGNGRVSGRRRERALPHRSQRALLGLARAGHRGRRRFPKVVGEAAQRLAGRAGRRLSDRSDTAVALGRRQTPAVYHRRPASGLPRALSQPARGTAGDPRNAAPWHPQRDLAGGRSLACRRRMGPGERRASRIAPDAGRAEACTAGLATACARGVMRLAVFTGRYPGRVATFFERDMVALLHAGIEVDVFPLRPYDPALWRYSLVVGGRALPRDRVHNIGLLQSLRQPWPLHRLGAFLRDAAAVTVSAARYGVGPLAKTLYALPKALAWAGRDAARYDHVLAYWGNYAGTCAYVFHRLTHA